MSCHLCTLNNFLCSLPRVLQQLKLDHVQLLNISLVYFHSSVNDNYFNFLKLSYLIKQKYYKTFFFACFNFRSPKIIKIKLSQISIVLLSIFSLKKVKLMMMKIAFILYKGENLKMELIH